MDFTRLKETAPLTGRPEWIPVLEYMADLHGRNLHPPQGILPYEWEDIGPGYCYGPAFGHWDIVHTILDSISAEPEHARRQLLNLFAVQQEDGRIPFIWVRNGEPTPTKRCAHPPVWIHAVNEYCAVCDSDELKITALPHLLRQIEWFESKRKAQPDGFYYLDILTHEWESGVDEGIRYLESPQEPLTCIDATSHVYALYDCAAKWLRTAGREPDEMGKKAVALKHFIQEKLFSDETGFFHDIWSVGVPEKRHYCLEGFAPMICGAASEAQAERLIDESLLNPERFLTKHPAPSVAINDPLYELRMMRGASWNSMTLWLARGCVRYGRPDAARTLLEMALDSTAEQFDRTGTVWEFYHPFCGRQEEVQRKPDTEFNIPCRAYVGHNPLFAMAGLWKQCVESEKQNRKQG